MLQLVQLKEGKNGKGYWAHPEGHPGGFRVPNHEALFTKWEEIKVKLGEGPWENLFVTNAHHLLEDGKGYAMPQRTWETFLYQAILPFDIDHCDTARAFEYLACAAITLDVNADDLILI